MFTISEQQLSLLFALARMTAQLLHDAPLLQVNNTISELYRTWHWQEKTFWEMLLGMLMIPPSALSISSVIGELRTLIYARADEILEPKVFEQRLLMQCGLDYSSLEYCYRLFNVAREVLPAKEEILSELEYQPLLLDKMFDYYTPNKVFSAIKKEYIETLSSYYQEVSDDTALD